MEDKSYFTDLSKAHESFMWLALTDEKVNGWKSPMKREWEREAH